MADKLRARNQAKFATLNKQGKCILPVGRRMRPLQRARWLASVL